MIVIKERVDVPSPPQAVWEVLSDPRAVVECVEGAELGERDDDGAYHAGLLVKFGPARVKFKARFTLDLNPVALSGKVSSRGKDNMGGTRIHADMSFQVLENADPPGSSVMIEASTEVTGRLSTVVEAGASRVVERMTADFARRLAARLTGIPLDEAAARTESETPSTEERSE